MIRNHTAWVSAAVLGMLILSSCGSGSDRPASASITTVAESATQATAITSTPGPADDTTTAVPSTTPPPSSSSAGTTTTTATTTTATTTTTLPVPVAGALQAAGWDDALITTVCLTVDLEFPQFDVPPVGLPISDQIAELLGAIGITPAGPAEPCDARLDLRVVHESLDKEYATEGQILRCFLGSRTRTDLALSAAGRPTHTDTLELGTGFPLVVAYCPEQPGVGADSVRWEEPVVGVLGDLWGSGVAVAAFRSHYPGLQGAGATALEGVPEQILLAMLPEFTAALTQVPLTEPVAVLLGSLGPQAVSAIPALIDTLTEIHDRHLAAGTLTARQLDAERIVDALCLITGENRYGSAQIETPRYWRQWWEEHRST